MATSTRIAAGAAQETVLVLPQLPVCFMGVARLESLLSQTFALRHMLGTPLVCLLVR